MSTIIKTEVFTFDELDDRAKEKAREWFRTDYPYDDWWDGIYDDFSRICDLLGVDLKTRTVNLYGGKTRQEPCIYFTGFWSQGDGACFEGRYHYAKGCSKAIRAYAAKDEELHRIADALTAIQRANGYQLWAKITHRGHYYHSHSMDISVERDNQEWPSDDAENDIKQAMRDLADWLYRTLEKEHDYLCSDEEVDESIRINEYTFTKNGTRFG